jgi:hypothetical protein
MHPQGQSSLLTGENGEKPKSPTNSAVTQNPCGTVTSFFHFTSGYSKLMYVFLLKIVMTHSLANDFG